MFANIPEVKLGIIAVSRDCFPIALSTQRRQNIVAAYGEGLYECPITVENEADALKALDQQETSRAWDILVRIQQEAEDAYIRAEET